MRIESSVTTISWIPSEAIASLPKMPFEVGIAHYDSPPPDAIDHRELDAMSKADRFRFANLLTGWIDVEDGRIVGHGQGGRGFITTTTVRLGSKKLVFTPVPFTAITPEPEVTDTYVRFFQTNGGRTGLPAPRRVNRPPFVKLSAPSAWTSLSLTLHAEGRVEREVTGASPFPRHWVYDGEGKLTAKTGTIDFKDWYHNAFGAKTPWGDEDSPALVTAVETALERELSTQIMRGDAKPKVRTVKEGDVLTEQGEAGEELYLVLDGVLTVEVDGSEVAQLGPGALLGERAILEGGIRTSTLRAATRCKVAIARPDDIDEEKLRALSDGRRREDG